jgi:PEP-CTERM motif
MTRKMSIAPAAAALFLLAGSVPASAGVVTFNFNSLGSGANSSLIQAYMNTVLAGNATVSVSAGAQADKGYNGDGHVVGSGNSTSRTLGTSEGNAGVTGGTAGGTSCGATGCTNTTNPSYLDTFIKNSGASSFFFDFSSNFVIDSVSFDYEIFPDGTCTSMSSAGCGGAAVGGIYPNQPDFTFSTDLGQVFHSYGTTPLSTNNDSPVSTTELTPQLGPINTGALVANVAGGNVLNFADWPATIGIDNLVITYHTPPVGGSAVPEPASLLLLGTGLLGVSARARRRRQAAKIV